MDRLEHFRRQAQVLSHRVERVIDLGQRLPPVLEHHRHAHELDIGRRRLGPALQIGLEVVAVRTPVGKEFDDLDLLSFFRRLDALEPRVLLAFDQVGRVGAGESQHRERADDKHGKSFHCYSCKGVDI